MMAHPGDASAGASHGGRERKRRSNEALAEAMKQIRELQRLLGKKQWKWKSSAKPSNPEPPFPE
jgi:hypothetical protein